MHGFTKRKLRPQKIYLKYNVIGMWVLNLKISVWWRHPIVQIWALTKIICVNGKFMWKTYHFYVNRWSYSTFHFCSFCNGHVMILEMMVSYRVLYAAKSLKCFTQWLIKSYEKSPVWYMHLDNRESKFNLVLFKSVLKGFWSL